MQAKRLLLLFVFMAIHVSSFAAINDLNETRSNAYIQLDTSSKEDYNPLLYILQSKTEPFLQLTIRYKPKSFFSAHHENAISDRKQLRVCLHYLKDSCAIDFKLASHSIAYPFHSFP